jgi:hypothetical protein
VFGEWKLGEFPVGLERRRLSACRPISAQPKAVKRCSSYGSKRIRLRTIWSRPSRCDPRRPVADGRSLLAPAARFHLAAKALDVLRIEDGLITEIVVFMPDNFPAFRLPMVMDAPPEMNKCH